MSIAAHVHPIKIGICKKSREDVSNQMRSKFYFFKAGNIPFLWPSSCCSCCRRFISAFFVGDFVKE